MSDETDVTSEVARVLGEHYGWHLSRPRKRPSDIAVYGCRGCSAEIWRDTYGDGWTADGMAASLAKHQAVVLAEAGLLRDYAVNAHESCNRELGNALAEVEAFRNDLTNLRDGLMERIGHYTPSDADLLAYVDALKAQIATQEPA